MTQICRNSTLISGTVCTAGHPDHNHGDEGKFVVVQQAYESLIKNKGREVAPRNEDSWNFHDWCGGPP